MTEKKGYKMASRNRFLIHSCEWCGLDGTLSYKDNEVKLTTLSSSMDGPSMCKVSKNGSDVSLISLNDVISLSLYLCEECVGDMLHVDVRLPNIQRPGMPDCPF